MELRCHRAEDCRCHRAEAWVGKGVEEEVRWQESGEKGSGVGGLLGRIQAPR